MLPRSAGRARARRWSWSSSPKRKSTWLITTSLRSSQPGSDETAVAKRVARSQQRSTRSATPSRPSERSAAYTVSARARRDDSGVQSAASRPHSALPLEVRRLHRHGRDVRLGPCAEGEPAVVRDVEPLVPVGRPRIGERDALDEAPSLRARCRPQPERAVDVKPRVRLAHDLDDLREVDRTSRCSPRPPARRRSSGRRARRAPRAALPAPLRPRSSASTTTSCDAPMPEQPQRPVDGHVAESPDDDADRRRLCEPALADVPASLGENLVPCGGECSHVRHLTARW